MSFSTISATGQNVAAILLTYICTQTGETRSTEPGGNLPKERASPVMGTLH